MDVSVNVGYFGPHISSEKNLIKELDEIGISCIWTAEAYGYDAVTPLSYFAALTENLNLFNTILLRNYIKYPNVFKNINPNMFKNPMRLRTYCV